MRRIRYHLTDHISDFRELIHEIHPVVQSAGSVDDNDVCTLGYCRTYGIVCHRSRVRTHFLLDDGNACPVCPYLQLLDCSCTESVSSPQNDILS